MNEDLADGALSYVELVRYRPDADFDEDGVLEQEKSTLRLKIRRVPDDDKIGLLNRILEKARQKGYTDMRVSYSPANDKSKLADFGTAREDVADVLTIKSSEVLLEAQRLQCESEIRDDVVEKLTALVLERRAEV